MARRGRQAVRNGGVPAWLLVVIGIVIGAIAMWLVERTGHMPISRPDNGPQPAMTTSQGNAGPGIAAQSQPKKPRYDFYSLLPEKEVRIPDAQLNAQVKAEQQAGTTSNAGASAGTTSGTPATGAAKPAAGQYLLQVASYENRSNAEAMKARLALKGFRAEIQPAAIDGTTSYRVRVGPFTTASQVEATKQKLEDAGFHNVFALKEQ